MRTAGILTSTIVLFSLGCGGSSAPTVANVARYQPIARDNAFFAKQSGWRIPGANPGVDDPADVDSDDGKPPGVPVAGTPSVGSPTPVGPPISTPPRPRDRTIPPDDVRLPPTPENLHGTWRGDARVYGVDQGRWRSDGKRYVTRYFATEDEAGNVITAVEIGQEVNRRTVPLAPPSPVDIDLAAKSITYRVGIQPVVVRIVEPDLMEVRGRDSRDTVVRFFERISNE